MEVERMEKSSSTVTDRTEIYGGRALSREGQSLMIRKLLT